jgi:hypothetical protein
MTKRPTRLTLDPPVMPLPAELGGHREAIEKALDTAVLAGTWPEGQTFHAADQPQAIGGVLIEALRRELVGANIAYLFREKMRSGGQVKYAKAGRSSALLEYLTSLDFVIEFNWTAWGQFTPLQRLACVDHYLCRCAKDSDSGLYVMRHPDVAEFGEIVRRYGLWTLDLRNFGRDVRSVQRDLFQEPAGAPAAAGVAE